MNKQTKLTIILGAVFLYIISAGLSFSIFRAKLQKAALPKPGATTDQKHFVIDPSIPRTEECVLNGKMHTKQERDIWETRRPLAVMIENHEESRPQSGLSFADIVYETVAEGGITRFMGIFYCGAAAFDVPFAPVRSARTYFLDWVSEYDALYNHVGGAGRCADDTVDPRAKALCQIDQYGIKDMDQFSISFPTCYRNYDRLDHPVATEHTMVCFSDKLYDLAKKRDWTNVDEEGVAWDKNFVPWKFKDDAKDADRGTIAAASFVHWKDYEAQYGVKWEYDKAANSYKRLNGGKPHIDLETKEQLSAKNVVIQFAKETSGIDEHLHELFATIGNGKALIFQDGQAVEWTWSKASRTARTKFFDDNGKEVQFVRGPIWIEVVDTAVEVNY